MTYFALGLAPDGSLSLQLPSGRSLEFIPCVEALRLIERILLDHAESPDRTQMTQWESDQILRRQRALKLELSVAERRQIEEEAEERKRQAVVGKAKQKARELKRSTGIDIKLMKINI